jgi:8-oxo-dGTP pyrophosphatase MutT (NUDIX family)
MSSRTFMHDRVRADRYFASFSFACRRMRSHAAQHRIIIRMMIPAHDNHDNHDNHDIDQRRERAVDETWYTRPAGVPDRVSAGGFVARLVNGRIMIAFAREGDFESLVVPKGGVDSGETVEDAAKREIEEELGVPAADLETLAKLGSCARLTHDKRRWVTVHYFLFRTESAGGAPTDTGRHWHAPTWVPLDDPPALFWPEQTALLLDNAQRIRELMLARPNA